MKIAIACDHAGFPLKTVIIDVIQAEGHDVLDLGTHSAQAVDYPDFAGARLFIDEVLPRFRA